MPIPRPSTLCVTVGLDTPWDSSAAACAASGLLELAALVDADGAVTLRRAARDLLQALEANCAAWDEDEEALLRFGTGNLPAGRNVGVPLIYGDYFFLEALGKLRGDIRSCW